MRFVLDHPGLPSDAYENGPVTLRYRWTAGQAWADLATFDPDIDAVEALTLTVFRGDGGFARTVGFQVSCHYSGDGLVFWEDALERLT